MSEQNCAVQLLQESKFGRILRDDQIEALAAIAIEERYEAETEIFCEGCPADAMWVICSGEIDVQMSLPHRVPETILTLSASDLLGWSALVGDGKMSAAAIARQDCHLLKLPAELLKNLCLDDHTLGYAVMGTVAFTLATRLKATRRQLLDLYTQKEAYTPLAIRISD